MGKGGIVRDPALASTSPSSAWRSATNELGWQVDEAIPSPITGAEGNQEFLLHARRGERS